MPFDSVQTPAFGQFLHRDRFRRVQTLLIDPALYPVQIDGAHFHLEGIVLSTAPLRIRDGLRRLASLEARGHFSVCMLTLLTATTCFALP